MRDNLLRDVRAAVADESRRAVDPLALQRAVAAQLARVMPFDLWCALTIDPGTGEPTAGFHEEGLPMRLFPRLNEIEQSPEPDFVSLRELARDPWGVRTLGDATGGDLPRSVRFRDVLQPSGVGHEVRAVLRTADGRPWGALVLMRGTDVGDFSPRQVGLLRSVSRTVADGLRHATVLRERPRPVEDAPGLLLCRVDNTVGVVHASASAQHWLDEVEGGHLGTLPFALGSIVQSAGLRGVGAARRVRIRTRTGRWLTAYAEALDDGTVSVILEPTRAHEIAELLADAFRLTAREREVAALATRGLTNQQIGDELFLSAYTVQDHLKAAFAKTGTGSRAELAAVLSLAPPGAANPRDAQAV